MPEIHATILIPDISGYTEYMTTTELNHSSHAITILLNSMVKAIGEEYEVAEVEGDALLLIRKGSPPTRSELLEICLKIFNTFNEQQKWMQHHSICPCNACLSIKDLTLKFVAHHGALTEIKVGKIIKQSGPNMIVAHRLLKNKIEGNKYLLVTENLWQNEPDLTTPGELDWKKSSEDYPSIGQVDFRYAMLDGLYKEIPEPPEPGPNLSANDTPYSEITIATHFRDVYIVLKSIPDRANWVPGLHAVEQNYPEPFVGSIHFCSFDDYTSVVSPIKMTLTEDCIYYAENCSIYEKQLSVIYEYKVMRTNHDDCLLQYRILNGSNIPIQDEMHSRLFENLRITMEKLKAYCEAMEGSFF